MNEDEARELCKQRNRNPDREMKGRRPFKTWELYALADELNSKPDETQG